MFYTVMTIIAVLYMASCMIRLYIFTCNNGLRYTILTPIRTIFRVYCILRYGYIGTDNLARFC